MAYAPTTQDRTGDYIFQAGQNAQNRALEQQKINMQQQEMMQDTMSSAITQFDEQSQLRGMARGKLGAQYDAGLMDEETLNRVIKMKPAEMYGYLAVQEQQIADASRDRYQQNMYDNSRNLIDYRASAAQSTAQFRNSLPPRATPSATQAPAPQFNVGPGINLY